MRLAQVLVSLEMKALTGLPTQAYAQVGEEAKIPVADLLLLVQALESNLDPSFIARYRPDISYGLDESNIRFVHTRLREYGDLADRKIAVLTSLSQQERLTPELRSQIESVRSRRDLEDLFAPFKPKPRSAADDAVDAGLEDLARFLWGQTPGDFLAEAAKYISPEKNIADADAALAGARSIVARWLAENGEVRSDLRRIAAEASGVTIEEVPLERKLSAKDAASRQRYAGLFGKSLSASSMPWKQLLNLRRGARESWLRYGIEIPRDRCLEYLHQRLIQDPESPLASQLHAAAEFALDNYLAHGLEGFVRQTLEDRGDEQAIKAYESNLRRSLMQAPVGPKVVIGIETNRPGGWRAAVVGANGELIEVAIVKADPIMQRRQESTVDSAPNATEEAANSNAEVTPEADAPSLTSTVEVDEPTPVEVAPASSSVEADTPTQESSEAEPAAAPEVESDAATSDSEPVTEAAVSEVEPTSDVVAAEAPSVETNTPAQESPEAAPTAAPEVVADTATSGSEPVTEAAASEVEPAPTAEIADVTAGVVAPTGPETEKAPLDTADPAVASEEAAQQEATVTAPEATAAKRAPKPKKKLKRIETPDADLADLIKKHGPAYVVLGNGPRVRQVERFVRAAVKKSGKRVGWITVNEAGSWIYATSRAARKEFPNAEPAVRAAACLARRLQDPLAEMSKLDPRVLGIGQGHHEVDQKSLRDALQRQASACANAVGVDINSAPAEVLELLPAMTDRVAKRIVEQREKVGPLQDLAAADKISGMNKRVWEQASGFFRIYGGSNPLDETGVRPELYSKTQELLDAAGVTAREAIDNQDKLQELDLDPLVDAKHPKAILEGIVQEFAPARRDPRGPFQESKSGNGLDPIDEPKSGMKVAGVVTNSASFGVFVDIGAEQDGLLHISQLTEDMVSDDRPKVKPGTKLTVFITYFDGESGKLSLSLREPSQTSRQRRTSPEARRGSGDGRRREGGGGWQKQRPERAPISRSFGPDGEQQAQARAKVENMSLGEKMAALGDKFRTKI